MNNQLKADGLYVSSIEFATASAFVNKWHRHHKSTVGHKFSLGCYLVSGHEYHLVGVAVVGRPVSRHLDDGETLEINRLCTTYPHSIKNVCSKLYSSCIKVAKKRGYKKIVTYTLMSENGASLKASNFTLDKIFAGGIKWSGKRKCFTEELKKRWIYNIS